MAMSDAPNAPEPGSASGKPRFRHVTSWLLAALALSLALNAFVIGAIVGERWRGGNHHHPMNSSVHGLGYGHMPGYSIRHFGAMLDSDARAKLRQAARPHRARLKLLLAEAAEARLDALEAMSARDFDAEALEASFARAREAEAAANALTQDIIAEAAAQFTPEERTAVNEALKQRMELWRERVERRRKRLEKWQERIERRESSEKQE
jgi:uncharacterized membrane protein